MVATRTKDYAASTSASTPPHRGSHGRPAARPVSQTRLTSAQEQAPGLDDGKPTAKTGLVLHEPTPLLDRGRHQDPQQRRHPSPSAHSLDPDPQHPQQSRRVPVRNDLADAPPFAPAAVLSRPDDDPHQPARAQPSQHQDRPHPNPRSAKPRPMPWTKAVLAFLRRHGQAVVVVVLVLTMASLAYVLDATTLWHWLLHACLLAKVFPGMTPWLEQVAAPIWAPVQPVVAVGAVCEEVLTCVGACTFKSSCR
ncbi:hypothetical protein BKA63DRAFT_497466 [Paraphoma chrysanthemicola]|nr:hypothetical protein BKA63DRAFT_497466 [Paraphoma chrysanthemicola]